MNWGVVVAGGCIGAVGPLILAPSEAELTAVPPEELADAGGG